jgi:hypothetical protein
MEGLIIAILGAVIAALVWLLARQRRAEIPHERFEELKYCLNGRSPDVIFIVYPLPPSCPHCNTSHISG